MGKIARQLFPPFLALILILIICINFTSASAYNINESLPISEKAAYFLLNYTYNDTMGLCSEVPKGRPNSIGFNGTVYWILTDNLFAYLALEKYNKTVSEKIKATIMEYAANYSLPTNDEGIPISYKHEPIMGEVLPEGMPKNPNFYNLTWTSNYLVCAEVNNSTDWPTWTMYADMLVWQGLSELNKGNRDAALQIYNSLVNMWNGRGFADKRYDEIGHYETFKLALFVIFRKRLGLSKPYIEEVMEEIIAKCQNPTTGGIAVNYDDSFNTFGGENTETTALIVLADINKKSLPAKISPWLLVGGIIAATVAMIIRFKKFLK